MAVKDSIIVEADKKTSVVKISGLKHFSVEKIFDCGQCFRFDKVENSTHSVEFSGVAFSRFVAFAQDDDTIYIYNSNEDEFERIWKRYLALDMDYSLVEEDISSRSDNESLKNAIEFSRGIRILNQEKWETVCSFIISQNNNIPRIKKIIEALSAKCGNKILITEEMEKHVSGSSSCCAFPTPEQILELGIDGLLELKTGFRAKYIYDAAQKVVSGVLDFSMIDSAITAEAINMLCTVKGIGPKVASCALLFGFNKYDAFPIDVWIKKVISKYFLTDKNDKFDPTELGEYAGIAQQFLFYYERYGGYKDYE